MKLSDSVICAPVRLQAATLLPARAGITVKPGNVEPLLHDPFRPILRHRNARQPTDSCRYKQGFRRSQILATIRRLLTEHGFKGVTVRRIAEASGCAVQTIYSLVGSREQAIVEAISEFTRFVGRTATPRTDDPFAVMDISNRWLQSIEATPEFCRQVSLIFFSDSRDVYYTYRDQQAGHMCKLLDRQRRCGALKPDIDVRDLAEQLVFLSSTLCLEWSDRSLPLEQLHRRLCSGYVSLMTGAMRRGFKDVDIATAG